jgi:hypothetical protein
MSYETILFFHIGAFIFNISLVILADIIGLLWVFGKIQNLPKKFILATHRFIWVGLFISVTSGLVLFWDSREYLLTLPAFYTKVLFVFALLVNSFVISKHLRRALEVKSFSDLGKKEKLLFFASGAFSTISWAAVVISANMLGL